MATASGVSLLVGTAAVAVVGAGGDATSARPIGSSFLNRHPWKGSIRCGTSGRMVVKPVSAAAPDKLSDKVAESVKEAEELCAGDPTSGECVAAWDEVEELSAAASHARDKKEPDPLETYCKDNPGSEECRTYED
ncbi:hypothetical protein Nepgr_029842 [Nepenthes gracilis]|uniref:CP12 domain-containing protein n=1 Tax=Nepenthes gracilis TaxID=150966 RepID=A0AAD3TF28_NEPGR|nr:hypothetical protein Nepgr_029842 [Nepenthes gracilis]